MNEGSKNSDFLRKVTNHERKEFWKNMLKKAVPADQSATLRAKKHQERHLEDADDQGENDDGNANNNYNQGYNYNQGNNYNYNNANGYWGDGEDAYQNNNNGGNYNYGGNNVNYNYNGNQANAEQSYQDYYDEQQNAWMYENYPGVDWANLGLT
jgi:hypothetical protein